MKKNIIIGLIFVFPFVKGQVAIGKETISSPSVSLEFYDAMDNLRCMILPWVTSVDEMTNSVNGTLVFDSTDKKVKYKKSDLWFDLSITSNGKVDTSILEDIPENKEAKVQIGSKSKEDNADGILVLSDTNKAMVLPLVRNPHLAIKNPEAGSIAYDPEKRLLAVYNGTVWTFWSSN